MKRFFLLLVIFVIAAAATAIITLPLGFALDRSGLAVRNISWASAQGTVWDGRIIGLRHNRQSYGDVQIKLRLADILTGSLAYDVRLEGAAARGSGIVRPTGSTTIEATEVRLEFDLSAFQVLDSKLRDIGGHLRIRGDRLVLGTNGCLEAEGSATTDLISRVAAAFAQSWPEASGDIRCEDGTLFVPLNGTGPAGETFNAEARLARTASEFEARVTGADPMLGYALATVGFKLNDGAHSYRWPAAEAPSLP